MSKFLKFIIHLVIICAIVCALGLVLPPFFGVRTVVVDDTSKKTNLPMGSVTYAIPKKTAEVYVGEPILVEDDNGTYRYAVQTMDLDKYTGTVVDPSVTDGKPFTVAVSEYVPKVVITIGYVGYLQVATKSIEGLIILGLAVLFLIILFIIAELWKKDDRDDEDEYDRTPIKSKKELKREEKERQRQYKEEERQIQKEGKAARRKKSEKNIVRTGGFVDEIDESDDDDEYEDEVIIDPIIGDAHDSLRKGVQEVAVEETSDEEYEEYEEEEYDDEAEDYEADEEEPDQAPMRAMPGHSAEELAEEAKEEGDTPDVVKDDVTDVTLFDYSDLFEDKEQDE